MSQTATGKTRIKKAIVFLIMVEVAYLVLVNAALRIPATQTLVNMVRPEKFSISWGRAWSWYPFRVHVQGLAVNGQSRSQQWQLDVRELSGSIAVVPLIFKRAWIRDVKATDIDYRQRPRLKADKDYSAVMRFFPTIDGREVTPAITTPRQKKRPWHIEVDDIRAVGRHAFWVYQARGSAEGELAADLSFQTQGGPFSLDGRHVDLKLDPLFLNGEQEVFTRGAVAGAVDFAPFIPRQNKGAALLQFLSLDVDVDFDLNSLQFINLFLLNLDGVSVDGNGQVQGRLRYERGNILTGTGLSVDARDLLVDILSHRIEGAGGVDLNLGPQTKELFDLTFHYEGLKLYRIGGPGTLLSGQGLRLSIGGNGRVLRDPDKPNATRSLTLVIDDLSIPDLSLLQRYLPEKWPFKLHGGSGNLNGMAHISPTALAVDFTLGSDSADLALRDYRFDTSLELALKLDNPDVNTRSTDVSGSYIRLSDAHLRREGDEQVEPWDASLVINDGHFDLLGEQNKDSQDKAVDLLQQLGQAESSELLGNSSAVMDFDANVSNLAWIGILVSEDYKLNVGGSGAVEGLVRIASGWPAPGTEVAVTSDELAVNVLGYTSHGDGEISLQVKEGEKHPDWLVEIALTDADFKRANEPVAYIHNVELYLAAVIQDVSFDKEIKSSSLDFKIRSATVSDMSTFNSYLPPDGSVRLVSGTADLTADIVLHPDDAVGWVKLHSTGLEAVVGEQSISADLDVDVLLADGVPADMTFDISGSQLRLDNVRVTGEEEQFDGAYWSALFELQRAETTWVPPVRLEMEAQVSMSDTRPMVAMFENQGRRPNFLSRMLTVEDIKGTATVLVADEQLKIINAHTISDNIEIGAKGTISKTSRDAVVYFRYKKADGLLKFQGDKKNLDVLGVKKKFDEYRVGL